MGAMTDQNRDSRQKTLHLGHSPDPDDAFMWYPLSCESVALDTGGYRFITVMKDIQSLNELSERGELEITAMSFHQYPYVADRYILTSCGASMGDGYGPVVVTRKPMEIESLKGTSLAIPGERTSAWLACKLLLAEHGLSQDDLAWRTVPFDQIIPRVAKGEYDAGLIIHEGQLTFHRYDLTSIVDLGKWWKKRFRLPLPLGANALRRDLIDEGKAICSILMESVNQALANHEQAIDYATRFARDMGHELAGRFVGMYVNRWTINFGVDGQLAIERFIQEGIDAGFVPDCGRIDVVTPGELM